MQSPPLMLLAHPAFQFLLGHTAFQFLSQLTQGPWGKVLSSSTAHFTQGSSGFFCMVVPELTVSFGQEN